MSKILLPIGYYPSPISGIPLGGGSMYIGDPDTPAADVSANQKTVSVLQEDGTLIAIAQPISLSPGGVPVSGSAYVSLYVDGEYSMQVLDSGGSQVYYVANGEPANDFDSVIDLRAVSVRPYEGQKATLTGYYTIGDGGGQGLVWDDSSTSSHNGYTVFSLTAFPTTGRYLSVNPDLLTVKHAGARGSGVITDVDTTFMQAAHDVGLPVKYPPGIFIFTTITINSGGIIGSGTATEKGTTLRSIDATTDSVITYTGNDAEFEIPIFRDFKVESTIDAKTDGGGLDFTSGGTGELKYAHIENVIVFNIPHGIIFDRSSHFNITGCKILDYKEHGIQINNAAGVDSGDSTINNCFINTTESTGDRFGINHISSAGLRIVNNKILGGVAGYVAEVVDMLGPLVIVGNSIEDQTTACMSFTRTSGLAYGGIVITGNEIKVPTGGNYGIRFILPSPSSDYFKRITITGNSIENHDTNADCISMARVTEFIISGNLLQGGVYGINLDGTCNGTIGINRYQDNGTLPINNLSANVGITYASQVATLDTTGTPSVSGFKNFLTGSGDAITDFDDGTVGQTIQIRADHTITITFNVNIIRLNIGVDYDMIEGDTLTLTMFEDGIWHEVSRSDTTA